MDELQSKELYLLFLLKYLMMDHLISLTYLLSSWGVFIALLLIVVGDPNIFRFFNKAEFAFVLASFEISSIILFDIFKSWAPISLVFFFAWYLLSHKVVCSSSLIANISLRQILHQR